MTKQEILKKFSINDYQEKLIELYISSLKEYNTHTNLVGKSTLKDPWQRHVLDCIQILPLIINKKHSILDMGTGAGLPGLILNIMGCSNVTLVDSNNKKIKFLKLIKKEMNLNIKILPCRLENIESYKYDTIISRALANLSMLFSYSHKFIKKNTVLIFLKGKTVNDEIVYAKKNWKFNYKKQNSFSDQRGSLLVVDNLKKL